MTKISNKSGRVPLERAFSKLGIASRSQARQWIIDGKVKVNGVKKCDPLLLVVPEKIKLSVEGRALGAASWRTIMLYKPRGVVTTRSDEKNRATVYSLLKEEDRHLHPVGRLDMATTGLLLMTSDTRLSNWLTDPKNKIPRVYTVTVEGMIGQAELDQLRHGVKDQGEILKLLEVVLRKASGRESHLTVTLVEGKNREIRRMFEAVGHEVTQLKRVAFGGLDLELLKPGEYRNISRREIMIQFPRAQVGDPNVPQKESVDE